MTDGTGVCVPVTIRKNLKCSPIPIKENNRRADLHLQQVIEYNSLITSQICETIKLSVQRIHFYTQIKNEEEKEEEEEEKGFLALPGLQDPGAGYVTALAVTQWPIS